MAIYVFLLICAIIVSVLLILVILSQNPKGGGLSSAFGGGGTQMFGVQRTNDFMDKATWTLATIVVLLVISASVYMIPKDSIKEQKSTDIPPKELPADNAKQQEKGAEVAKPATQKQ